MKLRLTGIFVIAITVILIVIGFAISEPIIQPEQYHQFSDTSTILGIPNFWNVISNLPFLIIGIAGVLYFLDQPNRLPYLIFFSGIALCFFGSCYYHWYPTTKTLVWDRLPMTVGFMALVSIVLMEYISIKIAYRALLPLIIAGFISIVYWVLSGDLRLYGLVQFYPMIALPVIILFYKSKYNANGYWMLFIFYIIAKFLEYFDHEIFNILGFIGGHPLKHISAAIGVFFLLRYYKTRQAIIE